MRELCGIHGRQILELIVRSGAAAVAEALVKSDYAGIMREVQTRRQPFFVDRLGEQKINIMRDLHRMSGDTHLRS